MATYELLEDRAASFRVLVSGLENWIDAGGAARRAVSILAGGAPDGEAAAPPGAGGPGAAPGTAPATSSGEAGGDEGARPTSRGCSSRPSTPTTSSTTRPGAPRCSSWTASTSA